MLKLAKITAFSAAALFALTACATNETTPETPDAPAEVAPESTMQGNIIGVGASSQAEAQNSWVASFLDIQPDVNVAYDPAGSGAGRENFQQGASDFAGSDRAFKIEEIAEGGFESCSADSSLVQLPLYISPIAIVFNIDGVSELNLDAATIAKIFTGEITKWNDQQIVEQNDGISLPDSTITAVHRADKSGTTGNFTDYLSVAAPEDWTYGSVEEWPLSAGEAAPQTSGVVSAVQGGQGTIGYVDASRAGDLGKVKVKVGENYVAYSPEAAAAVLDASEFESGREAGDLAIALDRGTDAANVYPIVLVSYLIACTSYADEAKSPLVSEYLSFIASEEGQKIASENAGSAPISDTLRAKVEEAIALIK